MSVLMSSSTPAVEYVKILKKSEIRKNAVIILKLEQYHFTTE